MSIVKSSITTACSPTESLKPNQFFWPQILFSLAGVISGCFRHFRLFTKSENIFFPPTFKVILNLEIPKFGLQLFVSVFLPLYAFFQAVHMNSYTMFYDQGSNFSVQNSNLLHWYWGPGEYFLCAFFLFVGGKLPVLPSLGPSELFSYLCLWISFMSRESLDLY